MFKHTPYLFTLLTAMLLGAGNLQAEMQPGDTIPAFEVVDQHEAAFTLGEGVHYLLVSFDMPTGKAANRFLAEKGAAYLPDHDAVYLSNIHGMPWIGRKFALPKMRKYPHRILLADEPEADMLAEFPQKDGQVTVFELAPGRTVQSVSFWDPQSGEPPFTD